MPKSKTIRQIGSIVITLIFLLISCNTNTNPTTKNTDSVFNLDDLTQAKTSSITSEITLNSKDLNNQEINIDIGDSETAVQEENSELTSQAVLPNVDGMLAYYRKQGSTYQAWIHDQATDVRTSVYSSNQRIQSVAVNADGSLLVASIFEEASNQFDVFLFDLTAEQVYNLTSTSNKNELDVSMTADGSTIVFTRPTNAGLNKINMCEYNLFNNSCDIAILGATEAQIQSSISSNGNYIALIRKQSNGRDRVLLYDVTTNSYTTVISRTDSLRHPSVNDEGTQVMYLQDRTNTSVGKFIVKIKNLTTNEIENEISSELLGHPHITADAAYFSYNSPAGSNQRSLTRNIATNERASAAGGDWDYGGSYWQKETGFMCNQLSLATNSGKPGDTIQLINAAGDFANVATYSGTYRVAGSSEEGVVFIEKIGSQLQLITPLHPDNNILGGDILINVTLNGRRCSALNFTIASLPDPEAQGVKDSYMSVADEIQDYIIGRAQNEGVNPDILKGELSELPNSLIGLGMNQYFIDHPDNPNSMKAIASRGTYIDEATGEEIAVNIQLMDSMFADKGLLNLYKEYFELLASEGLSMKNSSQFTLHDYSLGTLQTSECTKRPDNLTTAEELNDAMEAQARFESWSESLGNAVYVNTRIGMGLTVLGFFNPTAAAFALGFVAGTLPIIALQAELEAGASLLPSDLEKLSIEVTTKSFQAKGPVPETGEITKIELGIAQSESFSVLEFAVDIVANIPGINYLKRIYTGATDLDDLIIRYIADDLTNDLGAASFGPYCWDPIDVTDAPDFVEYEIESDSSEGPSIEFTSKPEYAPIEEKSGLNKIVANTVQGRFAGKSAEPGEAEVEVIGYLEVTDFEFPSYMETGSGVSHPTSITWEGTPKFPITETFYFVRDDGFTSSTYTSEYTAKENPLTDSVGSCICEFERCVSANFTYNFFISYEEQNSSKVSSEMETAFFTCSEYPIGSGSGVNDSAGTLPSIIIRKP